MKKQAYIVTAGSVGLILAAGAAYAQAPGGGGFGQFSVTSGTITGCMTGASTCSTLVSGAGFLQQEVTITSGLGAGQSFYRTIVTDAGVSGTGAGGNLPFADESYVSTNNNGGAVADSQTVAFTGNAGQASAGAGNTVICSVTQPCAGGVTTGIGQLASVTLGGVSLAQNTMNSSFAQGGLIQGGTAAQILAGTADTGGMEIRQAQNFEPSQTATGAANFGSATVTPGGTFNVADPDYNAAACTAAKPCVDVTNGGIADITTGNGLTPSSTNTSMQVNFQLYTTANESSTYMQMDEGRFAGTESTSVMTARRASGEFTPTGGTFTLPNGQTAAYNAGDDIAVTLMDLKDMGGGSFGYITNTTTGTAGNSGGVNAITDAETFRNYGTQQQTGYATSTANTVISYVNGNSYNSTLGENVQTMLYIPTVAGGITASNDVGNNAPSGTVGVDPAVLFTPLLTGTSTTTATAWPSTFWNADFGNTPVVNSDTTANAVLGSTSMTQAFP